MAKVVIVAGFLSSQFEMSSPGTVVLVIVALMLVWTECSQPSATYIVCGVISYIFSPASNEFHWEVSSPL